MSLMASYRKMKWYTKLGVWGSVASLVGIGIIPLTCNNANQTSEITTGRQSPIIHAQGNVSIQYSAMDSKTASDLTQSAVSEVLNQMDTNRTRVENLTRELETIRAREKAKDDEISTVKNDLTNALATILTLQSKLTNAVSLASLSRADIDRVNRTSNSVQKAMGTIGTLNVKELHIGTLILQ